MTGGTIAALVLSTRNHIQIPGTDTGFDQLTTPTDTQRRAFDLIGAAIPTTLK